MCPTEAVEGVGPAIGSEFLPDRRRNVPCKCLERGLSFLGVVGGIPLGETMCPADPRMRVEPPMGVKHFCLAPDRLIS